MDKKGHIRAAIGTIIITIVACTNLIILDASMDSYSVNIATYIYIVYCSIAFAIIFVITAHFKLKPEDIKKSIIKHSKFITRTGDFKIPSQYIRLNPLCKIKDKLIEINEEIGPAKCSYCGSLLTDIYCHYCMTGFSEIKYLKNKEPISISECVNQVNKNSEVRLCRNKNGTFKKSKIQIEKRYGL